MIVGIHPVDGQPRLKVHDLVLGNATLLAQRDDNHSKGERLD